MSEFYASVNSRYLNRMRPLREYLISPWWSNFSYVNAIWKLLTFRSLLYELSLNKAMVTSYKHNCVYIKFLAPDCYLFLVIK